MSADVLESPSLDDSGRWISARRVAVTAGAAILVGCVLVIAADPIARDFLARLLPHRGEISSRGTNFRRYQDVAPSVVRRTGIVLMVVGAAAGLAHYVDAHRRSMERASSSWLREAAPVAVIALTGVWYGWLASPHNAYPSNARFHWVDYLTWDSDNYFYAAGRLPHLLFYDQPHVWQAINAMIIATLLCALGRRWRISTVALTLMTATPAIASNLLLFANTAEDVLLNTAILLGTILAAYHRRPVAVGVMLGLAVLGRPSFIVLFGVLPAAEFVWALRRERRLSEAIHRTDWRYIATATATAVGFTAVAQTLFTVLGRRYMFTRGRIIDTGPLESQTPIEVDGFSISAFSGVFAWHALWVMPAVLLLGSLAAVWNARRYPRPEEPAVYFVALSAVGVLLLHESQPLNYYNVRYLTYVWPFLLVLAWHAFARMRQHHLPQRAAVLALLVLGVMVLPVDPIGVKRNVENRAETELLAVRSDVEDLGAGRPVALTFGAKSTQNFMAYVLRTNRALIALQPDQLEAGSLVVSLREDPAFEREPDLQTESIVMWVATTSDVGSSRD